MKRAECVVDPEMLQVLFGIEPQDLLLEAGHLPPVYQGEEFALQVRRVMPTKAMPEAYIVVIYDDADELRAHEAGR